MTAQRTGSPERRARGRAAARRTAAALLALAALACAAPARAKIHIAFGSKSELMLELGGTRMLDVGPLGRTQWPTVQLGAGYRAVSHLALGVDAGFDYIGRVPSSSDGNVIVTTETMALVPVTAYAKLLWRVGRTGEPFVAAGAGTSTFWMFPDQPTAPRHVETRPDVHGEAGYTLRTTRFSPRAELRYDARSTARDEVGLFPHGWFRTVTLSVGVQLP